MTNGYGITGIGYPMMGLGDYGLSTNSAYGNYDNYMLGMNGMGYMNNPMAMGMNPSVFGYGGYNPLFMGQMMSQMEQYQANHAANMHSTLLRNQTQAHTETDRALIDTILTNASVQKSVKTLATKVREGDQDGICLEYDKLRQQIYKTYGDEIRARGGEENPYEAATQIIDVLYTSIVTAQNGGETADLEQDIIKYGDKAFKNGFKQGHRSGHHDRYVDETLQHCFGYRIDEKESKDRAQAIGKGVGSVAKGLEWGVAGAGAGSAAYALTSKTLGGKTFFGKTIPKFNWKTMGKCAGYAGLALGAFMIVKDLLWKAGDSAIA